MSHLISDHLAALDENKASTQVIEALLEAVRARSAFALPIAERFDRHRLIQSGLKSLRPDTDLALVQELQARGVETLLAIATAPSATLVDFARKTNCLGGEVNLQGFAKSGARLIGFAIATALTADARIVGADVKMVVEPDTPGGKPRRSH